MKQKIIIKPESYSTHVVGGYPLIILHENEKEYAFYLPVKDMKLFSEAVDRLVATLTPASLSEDAQLEREMHHLLRIVIKDFDECINPDRATSDEIFVGHMERLVAKFNQLAAMRKGEE